MNTMANDIQTKEVVKFLKDTLTYLETRINLIDNKASILMAIQGGVFAIIICVLKEIFWTNKPSTINYIGYVIITLDFIFVSASVLLLLQTIRPSKSFFGLRSDLDLIDTESYVMWPRNNFPRSVEDYNTQIASLNLSTIKTN